MTRAREWLSLSAHLKVKRGSAQPSPYIDFIESKVPNIYVANELSVEGIVKKIELGLKKEIDSPNVNANPFLVFKDHDEKVVHERIADSFINFMSIHYDYK